MPEPVLLILAGGALALGAVAAQIEGPVSWNWRPRIGAIQHRLRCLPREAPSRGVRAAGLALLAALLAGGALAAYAAEPSAPQRLARDVVGVTGSGDALSLYLKEGDKLRRIKPGEAYDEGWTLKALSPSEVTLEKDGESRRVGLGPDGALAAGPAGPASRVQVVGWSDDELIARAISRGQWDGVKLQEGLNLQQTRRYWVLNGKFEVRYFAAWQDILDRSARAGMPEPTMNMREVDELAALGPAEGREYLELLNAGRLVRAVRTQAVYDQYGPVQVNVPSGTSPMTMLTATYGSDAQWAPSNRADGSTDYTLSPPRANLLTPLSAADNAGPLTPMALYPIDGQPNSFTVRVPPP